ncbi:MAG: single-stranded DNA-binding protein [Candidatus Margulisiibacteriota bacterium]|jgi:single-strand DNA-binding protein
MYNKIFLIGRLTRDPDQRYTPGGFAVTRFSVAVNRPVRGKGGENEADFFRVVAWRKLAEICGEYLKKGMLVAVEGRLQLDSFEKNGERVTMAEIVADNMQMLERKGESRPAEHVSQDQSSYPEEVPF